MTTSPTGYLTGAALYKAVSDMLFDGGPEVEMYHAGAGEWSKANAIYSACIYRFRPVPKLTQWVGYRDRATKQEHWKELVAPETVAPAEGEEYFAEGRTHTWCNNDIGCKQDLKSRRVFLCCEDSNVMDDFLTLCRSGGGAK